MGNKIELFPVGKISPVEAFGILAGAFTLYDIVFNAIIFENIYYSIGVYALAFIAVALSDKFGKFKSKRLTIYEIIGMLISAFVIINYGFLQLDVLNEFTIKVVAWGACFVTLVAMAKSD
ncbi:hypothetical protein J2127_000551 [Methanococcus voltae]|uniref:hypothetical protein n=1 Tax=Methanococcus voltae TaxID=2188 RepID=UPI001AE7B4CC|nr:hypothetical protein [Methanococcus voltae]MBP2143396.1 hypothetical protein [Methanococcus voltae]